MARRDSSVLAETDAKAKSFRQKKRKPVNVLRRTLLTLLALGIGLSLALAPVITNYMEYREYGKAVEGYASAASFLSPDKKAETLDSAYIYNEQLAGNRIPSVTEYEGILDIGAQGIMALLRIPKTETVLPIYHSTTPEDEIHGIVQVGPSGSSSRGSSLPVGGPSTHAFLSNVSSLPSAKLFDNAMQLEEGDTFNVLVCGQELVYEVTGAKTMTTEEASNMTISKGEDRMTLVVAPQDDEGTRYVVEASRSALGTSLYLGDYDTDDVSVIAKVVILNMSVPQGTMFIVGCAIVFFFLARWVVQLNDRAPRELGRLIGDSG